MDLIVLAAHKINITHSVNSFSLFRNNCRFSRDIFAKNIDGHETVFIS